MLYCDRLRPIVAMVVTDLKSPGAKAPCGFKSRPRHSKIKDFLRSGKIRQALREMLTATIDSHGP